jgi:hypothetical protein
MIAAFASNEAITWGDLLVILGVIALLVVIFTWFPRRRP